MKILKICLWVLLGLVILLVAGVVIFALTFDPNRYKDDVERLVKERTGRTLELKGPLEMAFWPTLGAKVAGVTLSERSPEREFLSLESAHASVAVMPLLRGDVVVDRVQVSGLKAQVVKDKDGKFNFQDLTQPQAGKPAAKAQPKADPGQPVKFDIAGITLERAAVTYRDLSSGQEIALQDLRLETGRIAENAQGKFDFSTALKRNEPPLSANVALNGSYSLKPDAVALDLSGKLDESSIKGKMAIARGAEAAYEFDLTIDQLNLDRYLASSEKKKPEAKKEEAPAKAETPQDAPVDLSGLKGLNAKGRVEIGALQVQGLKLANLKTELRAAQGRAEIGPHSAALYEGSLAGTLTLDGNSNRVALKETLTNIAVGPLLRDFADQDRLEGRGNVSLDVAGAGKTVNALKSALGGTARVHLRDGAIKGVNIGELLRKARSALSAQSGAQAADDKERTDFSELSATFTIKSGVAHNEDLELKAPLFRIGGAGDIDIGKSTINYVAKASVVASTQGQGGRDLEQLAGLTVPVRLSGPLDSMKYDVDYRAVAGDLAKSKIGGKVKEGIEKNRDKIEDKVRGRLKGLIGR